MGPSMSLIRHSVLSESTEVLEQPSITAFCLVASHLGNTENIISRYNRPAKRNVNCSGGVGCRVFSLDRSNSHFLSLYSNIDNLSS